MKKARLYCVLLIAFLCAILIRPYNVHAMGLTDQGNNRYKVVYDQAVKGCEYVLTVVKGTVNNYNVDDQSILYMDQKKADSKVVNFTFSLSQKESCVILIASNDGVCKTPAVVGSIEEEVDITKLNITLSKTSFAYTGKAITPSIYVSNSKGQVLKSGTDYQVSYANNKNVGKATVTVTGKGIYKGKKTLNFTITKATQSITASNLTITVGSSKAINAKAQSKLSYKLASKNVVQISSGKVKGLNPGTVKLTISAVETTNYKSAKREITVTVKPKGVSKVTVTSPKKSTLTVKWSKNSAVTGYQISISTAQTKTSIAQTITKNQTVQYTKTKLKKGQTYYVKVRTYKTVSKVKIYSDWSTVKKIKVK